MLTLLQTVGRRVLAVLHKLAWIGPLLVRLTLGIVFATTGWGKLHNLEQVIGYFASLGIPAPEIQARFVSGVEFIGGILLIIGLGTRIASAFLIGVMTVALLTAIVPDLQGGFVEFVKTTEL